MNRSILSALTFLTAMAAQAQFEIGAKAGLNYHFQSVTLGDNAPSGFSAPEGTNGLGFHVGGFLMVGLNDNLYLRPELLFSTRSSSEKTTSSLSIGGVSTSTDAEVKQTLTYLEVPVLFGLNLSKQLSLQVGPGFGILSGNKVRTTGTQSVTTGSGTVTTSLDNTSTSTDGLRSLELAAVAGVGYHAENGLDIGIRYWRGLNTLNENTDALKVNQNVVQVSLGFALFRN